LPYVLSAKTNLKYESQVETRVTRRLMMQCVDFCKWGIEKLAPRYGKCRSSSAEYVEKWSEVSTVFVRGENQEPIYITYVAFM
jgi:hypothetical protein